MEESDSFFPLQIPGPTLEQHELVFQDADTLKAWVENEEKQWAWLKESHRPQLWARSFADFKAILGGISLVDSPNDNMRFQHRRNMLARMRIAEKTEVLAIRPPIRWGVIDNDLSRACCD